MGLLVDVRSRVRAALVMAGLVLAGGSHAAGLFLPVSPGGAAADVAPPAGSAPAMRNTGAVAEAWEQRVRIARHELNAAREDVESTGAGRLLLNMRESVRLDVVVERTAPTRWGYSLSGRVAGRSLGFVTLVVHKEAVAGSIWMPDSEYELAYLGSGVHALRDVTSAPPFVCAGAPYSKELSAAEAATAQQGSTDDGAVVDILVVWTPAAKAEYGGGDPQILSRIEMLVAYANDAFERSGAFVSLRLVGAEQVDYTEADSGDWFLDSQTDLTRLRDPDDGHMDGVHQRRDALGADIVNLLHSRGGGLAGSSFSISAGHVWVFAHEIGHNFGLKHDRYDGGMAGYRHGFTTRSCDRTIMSYANKCDGLLTFTLSSVPFYASPWLYSPLDGHAFGVDRFSKVRGARGPADAVLTLNRNRHSVANLRPSRQDGER